MGSEDTIERLARIEALMGGMQAEVSAMRDAIQRLVRIEEQHAGTQDAVRRLFDRMDRQDERIDAHDRALERLEQTRTVLAWVAGIVAAAAATLASLIIGRLIGG